MNYQEFTGSVTGFLRETLPYGTELQVVPMEKNNGVIVDGLTIKKEGQNIAPTIYLNAYYKDYLAGRSVQNICEQILECYEECDVMEQFDVDFFADYRNVRPLIAYKLIDYEKNQKLLEEVPHLPFLNLAIVFYCLMLDTPVGNASVLIQNHHMKHWKVRCSDLYQAAKENMKRLLPLELKTMSEVILELSGEAEESGIPMFVLTNERRTLGAASILYEGALKHCADVIGEGYYLLPSSIHEWILIPESVILDTRELAEMVREINRTQVRDTEVLSECIYQYLPKSGQIFQVEA